MFCTYILESLKNGRFYIGHCEEVQTRIEEHNAGVTPSTRPYRPWKLVYTETFETRSHAIRRENEIKKKKKRSYIEKLIGQLGRASRP